ncbi:CAP domain-containing protein [Verrucomicrobiaceae bacterium E54]|nr:CAP domain-containing protein [Verrucomicrobiaceae bacterium E54]
MVGSLALLASCSSSLDTTRIPMSASSGAAESSARSSSDMADRLERSLNEYRASIGKAPIPRHAGLDAMARRHCEFMARNRGKFSLGSDNISHFGFEERAMLAERRYGLGHCAENVAGGMIPGNIPSELTKAWVGSSKHVYNLKHDWSATGIGVYVAPDGYVYATQIFGNKVHSEMGMNGRFGIF